MDLAACTPSPCDYHLKPLPREGARSHRSTMSPRHYDETCSHKSRPGSGACVPLLSSSAYSSTRERVRTCGIGTRGDPSPGRGGWVAGGGETLWIVRSRDHDESDLLLRFHEDQLAFVDVPHVQMQVQLSGVFRRNRADMPLGAGISRRVAAFGRREVIGGQRVAEVSFGVPGRGKRRTVLGVDVNEGEVLRLRPIAARRGLRRGEALGGRDRLTNSDGPYDSERPITIQGAIGLFVRADCRRI